MRFDFRDFDGVDILGGFYIYHFCIQIRKYPERRNHVWSRERRMVNERKEQAQGSSEQNKWISVRGFISTEFLWATSDSYCSGADILSVVIINKKSYKLLGWNTDTVLLKSMGAHVNSLTYRSE